MCCFLIEGLFIHLVKAGVFINSADKYGLALICAPQNISTVTRENSTQGQTSCGEFVSLFVGQALRGLVCIVPLGKNAVDPGCLMSLCLYAIYTDSKADAHHLF